jgi:nucleoside-diphosphate-sugar epimerase
VNAAGQLSYGPGHRRHARKILLTGATGFIGRRVLDSLHTADGVGLRLLHRGSCTGVDVLVHCASSVEPDPQRCQAVNVDGTRALLTEARRAGVRRVIYLSTASVYGRGTFRDVEPDALAVAPGSVVSRSRAQAEQEVLEVGGTVLRPFLVYGAGDRWLIPGVARLHRLLRASLGQWQARISMVDVLDLARAISAVALTPREVAGAWHVNHPPPVPCGRLSSAAAGVLNLPAAERDISVADARRQLSAHPVESRYLEILANDHWFASDRLWSYLDCPPGQPFDQGIARHAGWYRRELAQTIVKPPSTTSV